MNVLTDNSKTGGVLVVNQLGFKHPCQKRSNRYLPKEITTIWRGSIDAPEFMASIVALSKGSLKPRHRINQITLRGFQQQMVMVSHQTSGVNNRLITNTHFTETTDK
jgi:hypothetical protein